MSALFICIEKLFRKTLLHAALAFVFFRPDLSAYYGIRQTPCNGFLINFCQSPVRASQASCLGKIMRIDLQQISKVHRGRESSAGLSAELGPRPRPRAQSVTLSFGFLYAQTEHNMNLAICWRWFLIMISRKCSTKFHWPLTAQEWREGRAGSWGTFPPTRLKS